jgi:HEAT repeat protein
MARMSTGETRRRVKPPASPTTQLEERARALLAAPVSEFVSEAVERELPTIVSALAGGAAQALAEDLVGRLAGCMREDEGAIRRRAVSMAGRALTETSTAAKEMVLARFQDQLQLSLAAERDAAVVRLLGDAARSWMSAALLTNQIPALMGFLSGGLKLRYESADAPVTLRTSVSATLRLLAERTPHPVLEAIASGNPRARQAAMKVAGLVGAALTPSLVALVSTHADGQVRRTAAAALKEIGGTAGAELADVVKPQADANTITRVLEVYELASPANLSSVVLAALKHADAAVRQSAFRLLRRGERHAAVDTLRTLLAMEDAETRSEALSLARDRKFADLVPDVVRMCEKLEDDNLLRQACYYFRECPSRSALPVLQRLFEKRTRIFGLVKGATTRTRAAAVEAMARINDPVVKQLMEIAQEDRSQTVRRAAVRPDEKK